MEFYLWLIISFAVGYYCGMRVTRWSFKTILEREGVIND